jgi:hypothetical protein
LSLLEEEPFPEGRPVPYGIGVKKSCFPDDGRNKERFLQGLADFSILEKRTDAAAVSALRSAEETNPVKIPSPIMFGPRSGSKINAGSRVTNIQKFRKLNKTGGKFILYDTKQ